MDYTVVSRSVYDVLNFLGDVGGLEGILTQIGALLVSSAATFVGVGYFIQSLFYTRTSPNPSITHEDEESSQANITGFLNGERYTQSDLDAYKRKIGLDFQSQFKIPQPRLLAVLAWGCVCRREYKNYKLAHA